MTQVPLPYERDFHLTSIGALYIAVKREPALIVKLGYTSRNWRKRNDELRRRDAAQIIAAWPGVEDEEQDFHYRYGRYRDPNLAPKREWYHPTMPVVFALVTFLTSAEERAVYPLGWDVLRVTEELQRRHKAWAGEVTGDRWPMVD